VGVSSCATRWRPLRSVARVQELRSTGMMSRVCPGSVV